MIMALLNGVVIAPDHAGIHVDDRGLLYGDGLFETMLLQNGKVRFIDDHLQRLRQGCERLKISLPARDTLRAELQQLVTQHHDGIVKLIVTRGRGARGYCASDNEATRLWQVFPPLNPSVAGITLRWCDTRLARNEQLAGLKHLNRLEQVMAQSEWNDAGVAEGLMLDTEGELISGTMSNVFIVIDDVLVTPDLRFCGVQGIMRKNILCMASELNMPVEERSLRPQELLSASEMFLTNAVRGIQPVAALLPAVLDELKWPTGAIAIQLMKKLTERD